MTEMTEMTEQIQQAVQAKTPEKTDILAVNPGSTSTKVGVFRQGEPLLIKTINHNPNHLLSYGQLENQIPYRLSVIHEILEEKNYDLSRLRAVVGRGGTLRGLKAGGYEVTAKFRQDMLDPHNDQHASILGAPLAFDIAAPLGIPAYIYDSVMACELLDVAKLSGLAGIDRYGSCHVLNSRAQGINYAASIGRKYQQLRLIVCHMGGGITVMAHQDGRIIDDVSYDEGAMSPERTGGIQLLQWTRLCYSGKYTEAEVKKLIAGKGGLYDHLGVTDCRQVERMIEAGNKKAALVYEAMAYQAAKAIAQMSVPLRGQVDAVILTGGAAHSKLLTSMIEAYAGHIGKFVIMPGEDELQALANGAARILDGEEAANPYE